MTGTWKPVHDRHAIDGVAFLLFFSSNFPPMLFQKLSDVLNDGLATLGLNTVRPIEGMEISSDSSTPVQREFGTQYLNVEGLTLRQIQGGNYRELVSLEENSIGYRCSLYPGWDEALARFNSVLSMIFPLIRDVMTPARLRLEYQDKFIWQGNGEPESALLMRSASRFVAPHALQSKGHWHSNSGAFLPSARAGVSSVLQISLQTGHLQHVETTEVVFGVTMVTAREDRYDDQDVKLAVATYNEMTDVLNEMHSNLLDTMREIVTDEIAATIGLAGE